MRTLILLFVALMNAVAVADEFPTAGDLAKMAASDAKRMEKLLQEAWTVRVEGNEITLESKFEVFHISMISRSSAPPEFSNDTPRTRLMAETKPERYIIRLKYEKRIPKEELERRRNARQKAADILTHGAGSKDEYHEAGDQFAAIRVPRYQSNFCHIYEELPETPYGRFYPPKAVLKVGGAKEILATVLGRIRTGND
jgi:hypothetical protein